MANELHEARLRVAQLEDDSVRFVLPDKTGLGDVLPHNYGTGTRYGLVVEVEPDIRVIWFTGNAEKVDHLLTPEPE